MLLPRPVLLLLLLLLSVVAVVPMFKARMHATATPFRNCVTLWNVNRLA